MGRWQYIGDGRFEDERDTRSPEQRAYDSELAEKLNSEFRNDFQTRQEQYAVWNNLGQYAKIGEFVFPIEIDSRDTDAGRSGKHIQTRVFFQQGSEKKEISFFKSSSASASDPWLMLDEYCLRHHAHSELNIISSKWW